jgi:hypothetical protein
MLPRIRVALIVLVLIFFAALPISMILYGAAAGVIGGGGLVLALIAVQYPLMRYVTRNLKDEDSEP